MRNNPRKKFWTAASATFTLFSLISICGSALARDGLTGPLTLKDQGSFFVGGREFTTDAMSVNSAVPVPYPNTDVIKVDQMYVQYQIPMHNAKSVPFVLVHGCCLSAKSYEDTPDGRMGWAEYFVRKNHPVYLVDQSSRARSGFNATTINEVHLGMQPPSALPNIFTFGRKSAWDLFRFGPSYPTPFPDEQFPVEAMSDFGNQVIPDLNSTLPDPNPSYQNLATLAKMAGGAVVVGHSETAFFPQMAALTDSSGIKGIVSLEGGCPVLNSAQIQSLSKIPTLVVFGDHLDGPAVSGQFWLGLLQSCQAFVQQLKAAGGDAELVQLPQVGFKGNSHMLMQDRNNIQVADWMLSWLAQHVPQGHAQARIGKNRMMSDD